MTGEMSMDQFTRLESKLDEIEDHADERQRTVLAKIEALWERITSVDRAVAVMQAKEGSAERMALDHELRIRSLETFRWYLHGFTGAIAVAASWVVNKIFGSN